MEHNFEANFFTLLDLLDLTSRYRIEGAWKPMAIAPHQVIYEQGSESNAVYIVVSGVVEAVTHSPDGKQTRSIAFMERGDFFGDLGILTNQPRLATVRSCEEVQILKIDKATFINLMEKVPKLGLYFSRNLARRLHKTSSDAHRNIYSLDLAGNLQHFDLLTIFQAITSMGRSGELRLNNSSNDLIGSFFFREGRVEHARFVHLEGVEAIWQGFVESATEGTFTFRVMAQPSLPFTDEHRIELDSTGLLMEGVGRRDTYQALPENLRKMEGRLSRLTESLQWTDADAEAPAGRVWELIAKRPQPLASLWRRMNYSALTFLEVVNTLLTTGQAALLPEEPVAQKVLVEGQPPASP